MDLRFHTYRRPRRATAAIRQVLAALPAYPFVFKTDVQRYDASIDQVVLMEQVAAHVDEPSIRRLVWQAIRRTTWEDGRYREHGRGIALGCPLSPLLGGCLWPRSTRR